MANTAQITWKSSQNPPKDNKLVLIAAGPNTRRVHVVTAGFYEEGCWYYSSCEKVALRVIAWGVMPEAPSEEDLAS